MTKYHEIRAVADEAQVGLLTICDKLRVTGIPVYFQIKDTLLWKSNRTSGLYSGWAATAHWLLPTAQSAGSVQSGSRPNCGLRSDALVLGYACPVSHVLHVRTEAGEEARGPLYCGTQRLPWPPEALPRVMIDNLYLDDHGRTCLLAAFGRHELLHAPPPDLTLPDNVDWKDLAAVFDTQHPNHAKELVTAIRGWIRYHSAADTDAAKKKVYDFAVQLGHSAGKGGAAERIATVVNPDRSKDGGARRTLSKKK